MKKGHETIYILDKKEANGIAQLWMNTNFLKKIFLNTL